MVDSEYISFYNLAGDALKEATLAGGKSMQWKVVVLAIAGLFLMSCMSMQPKMNEEDTGGGTFEVEVDVGLGLLTENELVVRPSDSLFWLLVCDCLQRARETQWSLRGIGVLDSEKDYNEITHAYLKKILSLPFEERLKAPICGSGEGSLNFANVLEVGDWVFEMWGSDPDVINGFLPLLVQNAKEHIARLRNARDQGVLSKGMALDCMRLLATWPERDWGISRTQLDFTPNETTGIAARERIQKEMQYEMSSDSCNYHVFIDPWSGVLPAPG